MTMNLQSMLSDQWINWARPTAVDADEFFQVEIRLSKQDDRTAHTTCAFWGNVGLGTPWRRTWRWHGSKEFEQELRNLAQPQDIDDVISERVQRLMDLGDGDEANLKPLVVRVYRSISRSWHPHKGIWIIDAVADDGTAWHSETGLRSAGEWWPHPGLPQPDQPED